ncbi:MAG: acyltransferase family protein, partial [Rhizobiaceae bacterium]
IWRSPEPAFYHLPNRAWELLAGSILAIRTVPPPPTSMIATGAVTIGIGIILASVFVLSEQTTFPGLSAMLPVVGSALGIWGGERRNIAAAALGFAPLVYIGRISYSLYLVHWPVLFFATRLISDTGAAARTTIVIAMSLVLADLSYRFIETPTRRRSPFWTSGRIFWLTATGVLVGVGLSLGTILAGGFSGRLPADARALLAYRYDRAAGYREGTCFLQRDQPASALAPECLPTNGPIALIWGDSHAAHLLPGLQPALEGKGYAVAQITASGCQPVRGFETPRRPNCGSVNDFALDWIRRTKPSLVILSAIWTLDGHMDSFRSQIDELAALGIQTIILGPSPIFPEAIPVLLAERLTRGDQTTSWDNLPPDTFAYDVELGEAFKTWPARYVSLLEIACPQQSCPLILDRMPIYWDGEHLTTAGAQALVAGFVDRIPAPL